MSWLSILSTPHGALGTVEGVVVGGCLRVLSTPHGALGTLFTRLIGLRF